ncbi:hypothetical protein AAH211_22405 [Serratia fonticola]|uniref:hypothetical protein n=1 Tax=Serratia fonticola TaxID=47917 RepID=UPI0039866B9E
MRDGKPEEFKINNCDSDAALKKLKLDCVKVTGIIDERLKSNPRNVGFYNSVNVHVNSQTQCLGIREGYFNVFISVYSSRDVAEEARGLLIKLGHDAEGIIG